MWTLDQSCAPPTVGAQFLATMLLKWEDML
jgi:hypothetical protein